MGFGAIITSEDKNTPLSDDLLKWLVEARDGLDHPACVGVDHRDAVAAVVGHQ